MTSNIAKDIDFWAHCQTLPVSSICWEGNETVVMADEFMKLVDYAKEQAAKVDKLEKEIARTTKILKIGG